ncbi:uncharacterized protein MYCFIDRAFT_175632 [Pseudocercospora fijiensis CIRAD86]|uniref:Uncharacterized protein n=1 Tax=Pseudocercospora fijiensis (strain CIRAD86) TaxID=383855 RepID=M3ABY1_PSEFD|nr:uncharacterized protein MYCFIDRAFT_175632 [Pseudocercospora fijiensis CIRAD86]EME82076.1 hypothetical protein MYCFIDRAFT_175632 [Pseudocercospora fijiensis CIRAD86]
MTVIMDKLPSIKSLYNSYYALSPPVSTETPTVDSAPITHNKEPSSEDRIRVPCPIPPRDSNLDMEANQVEPEQCGFIPLYDGCNAPRTKFEEGKGHPVRGYCDHHVPWSLEPVDGSEPQDVGANGIDGAVLEHGKNTGADETPLPTPSANTAPDGEDASRADDYGPWGEPITFADFTYLTLLSLVKDSEHWVPNDVSASASQTLTWNDIENADLEKFSGDERGFVTSEPDALYTPCVYAPSLHEPSLTASLDHDASSQRSEAAEVCSLVLLLLIISLTLSSLYKYLQRRASAAGMRSPAKSRKSANDDGNNVENHPACSSGMTLGFVSGSLLTLSMSRTHDQALERAGICVGTVTLSWLIMNTLATVNVIVHERPAWAVRILDHIKAFFDQVTKKSRAGYAKICNAILRLAWHCAFAIMLMAFIMLLLANATMKSLPETTGEEKASNQGSSAAQKKQGEENDDAKHKAWTKPCTLEELDPPKINPWLKRAEEQRAKIASASRAWESSSDEPKAKSASEADERLPARFIWRSQKERLMKKVRYQLLLKIVRFAFDRIYGHRHRHVQSLIAALKGEFYNQLHHFPRRLETEFGSQTHTVSASQHFSLSLSPTTHIRFIFQTPPKILPSSLACLASAAPLDRQTEEEEEEYQVGFSANLNAGGLLAAAAQGDFNAAAEVANYGFNAVGDAADYKLSRSSSKALRLLKASRLNRMLSTRVHTEASVKAQQIVLVINN